MKILLIDDDMFMRDMYATKFAESNHEVEAFDQSEKALVDLRKKNDYDVILCDMVMPSMSGTEFLQTVKAEGLLGNSVPIVLSNQGQHADIDEAMEAGAVAYLVKAEFVPSEIVEKVEAIYAEHKAGD